MSDALITQPDLGANQEGQHYGDRDVRDLARQGARIVAHHQLGLSGSRVRTLVREYVRDGPADDFETYLLTYLDPTGERAVENVLRAEGGR